MPIFVPFIVIVANETGLPSASTTLPVISLLFPGEIDALAEVGVVRTLLFCLATGLVTGRDAGAAVATGVFFAISFFTGLGGLYHSLSSSIMCSEFSRYSFLFVITSRPFCFLIR